jgi:hypothetical protein
MDEASSTQSVYLLDPEMGLVSEEIHRSSNTPWNQPIREYPGCQAADFE